MPSMLRALGLISNITQNQVWWHRPVIPACRKERDVGGLGDQGHPWLYEELKASWAYMRACLKKEKLKCVWGEQNKSQWSISFVLQ